MVEILQALHGQTGRSFRRLIPALGLARSSVLRWAGRLRQGLPAIRMPAPPKARPENPAALDAAIAQLPHRVHRTFGTSGLWRKWQATISRRDFNDRVRTERRRRLREQRDSLYRIAWKQAGAVWAMDPAEYGGILWNLVVDLASRFRFELTVALHLPAPRIVNHLQRLFDRYGPPLVLKRDNGSNLVAPVVDELLDAYGVMSDDAARVRDWAKTRRTLDQLDLGSLAEVDKVLLLQQAVFVTYIDGVQTDQELKLLHELGRKLGLGQGRADELIKTTTARAKARYEEERAAAH